MSIDKLLGDVTTAAALAEKMKLREGFKSFDTICYTHEAPCLCGQRRPTPWPSSR